MARLADNWEGPEEPVYDHECQLLGFVRPYLANGSHTKVWWAWRHAGSSVWNCVVKDPAHKIRHRAVAAALVIASKYGQ